MRAAIYCFTVIVMGITFTTSWSSFAGDVTSRSISRALQGKPEDARSEPKMRSIQSVRPRRKILTKPESNFISTLRNRSRAISVVERNKLGDIVDKHNLPAIDLEVYFDHDSADITSRAKPDLIELGNALREPALSDKVFLVSGHTDATGSNDYNQSLSERRARSVKVFLTKTFNIDAGRLIAVGYGEERLKNFDDPHARENRRVTIVNLVP